MRTENRSKQRATSDLGASAGHRILSVGADYAEFVPTSQTLEG